MITRFEMLSQEEKLLKIFDIAFKYCQNSILDIRALIEEKNSIVDRSIVDRAIFNVPIDELKAMRKYLSHLLGNEGGVVID